MTRTSGLPKSLRYWLSQSLISLIAVVVALLLLEFGFRVARRGAVSIDRLEWRDNRQPAAANKIYEKSQEFEFTATLNQDGFRGSVALKKLAETRRLLVLGDSFIFGWGVNDDQTFAHILDRVVNRQRKQLEILNAAGGSLSPLVYYVMLKKRLLEYAPDAVIVFLNYADLREDYSFQKNIIRGENNAIVDLDPMVVDGRLDRWRWVRNHCEFCSFTYNKMARPLRQIQALGFWHYLLIKFKGQRVRDAIYESDTRADRFPSIELDSYFMLRQKTDAHEIRKYWRETAQNLTLIDELLKQRNIPWILALLPHGIQVGPIQWGNREGALGIRDGKGLR